VSFALTSKRAVLAPGQWVRNELWRRARAVPSLDLRFADNKSLSDAVTGQSLVTFTRASSGTYVGSDGLIKTATTNLLLRSEEFDNASWTKSNASITANAALAPDGFNTADKLIEDIATNTHLVQPSSSPSWTSGTSYTYSVYAKSAERTFVQLRVTAGNTFSASFDLTAGVASQLAAGTTAQITGLASSWYRISITFTASATATGAARIGLMTNATTSGYTGDGTSGLYIWGAQLEQSSTVGEYIPTTSTINSAPRFDHNPTTGESLGLLVEEQRTNLLLQSENLATTWAPTGSSVSVNTAISPDGQTTADTLTEDTSTGNHSVNSAAIAWAGNTTYTCAVYAKANTRSLLVVAFGTANNWVNSQRNAVFNLSNGTIFSQAGSSVTASIQALPNNWYRCVMTATTIASPLASTVQLQLHDGSSASYTGNGTSGLFIWGAQLEVGSFPTSYIPTTTATVTRSADVASITGANFSSWYRQDEGTVFAEGSSAWASGNFVGSSDNTNNNRIFVGVTSGPSSRLLITTSGSSAASITVPYTLNAFLKGAGGYRENSSQFVANGVLGTEDTICAIPTVNKLSIGSNTTSSDFFLNGTIRRLTYWPQRLPNSTLQAVTQ